MNLFIAGLLVVSFGSVATAESFEVHPTGNSRFALTVEKTGLYHGKKHLLQFEKYQGTLEFDRQKPDEATIQLTIDSRSLVCKDDWVSAGDLKKIEQTALEDMLAAKKYPSMTFTSSSIKALGGGRFEAIGVLTIRALPAPVSVTVQLDAADPASLRLDGSAVVRLTDYKLKPPSALLGTIGTKNEMSLNFSVTATRVAGR